MAATKRKYEEGPGCGKENKVWTFAILNEDGHSHKHECDDEIQVPSKTSLIELVTMLCNGPVKERRGYDHDINAHLWDLKIIPAEPSTEKKQEMYSLQCGIYSSDHDNATLDPSALIEDLKYLELQGTLCLKYDYGSPTIVTMKVQSVSSPDPGKEDQKLELQSSRGEAVTIQETSNDMVKDDSQKKLDQNDISKVSAYDLPLSKQLDAVTDLSPSNPRPVVPPIFSEKDDSVVISKAKALAPVTALAIAPAGGVETKSGTSFLYSGHRNGEVCKWNLETNEEIWKKQVFLDPGEMYHNVLFGIRGIAVQESSSGEHLVYTWAHNYDSIERDLPNDIKVLNGRDGHSHHVLRCQVDCDMDRHPIISCIIFSKLMYEDIWYDTVLVGLKVTCESLTYNENYTNFNLEEAEDFAYGNILPFVGEDVEETWRGHEGTIRSMATTPDRYIVSCSENSRGFAEAIILWSAKTPGVPLHRIDLLKKELCSGSLCPPLRSLQGGIAVHGNKILIGGEYGDMIVPIDIVVIDEGGDEKPLLDIRGFGKLGLRYSVDDSLKGCLVGSGNVAIISNEGCEEVYVFPIDSLGNNPILDNDMSPRAIEKLDETFDVGDDTHLHVRSMALGQIKFPFQKDRPSNKHAEQLSTNVGPMVLAMKGRYVVAGFNSGSIVRAKLLPEEFEDRSKGSPSMYASSALHGDQSPAPHFDEFDHPPDDPPPEIPPQCLIQ